jgi:hypothetical protein
MNTGGHKGRCESSGIVRALYSCGYLLLLVFQTILQNEIQYDEDGIFFPYNCGTRSNYADREPALQASNT